MDPTKIFAWDPKRDPKRDPTHDLERGPAKGLQRENIDILEEIQ